MPIKEGCSNCPLRLFNKRHYMQGAGNLYTGKVIIVPSIDNVAYKRCNFECSEYISIIKEVLHISSTGELDTAIIPLIRCKESIECPLNSDIINNCISYLKQDFIKYDFKDILVCGDAARTILNVSDIKPYTNNLFISNNKRRYVVTYNPLVYHTNDELFEQFKKDLVRWYYSVNNKYFDSYEVIYDNKQNTRR